MLDQVETGQRALLTGIAGAKTSQARSPEEDLSLVFLRVAVRNPTLALEALRLAAATAATGWIIRFPFLPVPEPTYRDWRLLTAYGTHDHQPSPEEVEEFLRWRREIRRI